MKILNKKKFKDNQKVKVVQMKKVRIQAVFIHPTTVIQHKK